MQVEAPSSDALLPTTHTSQEVALLEPAKRPTAHSSHASREALRNEPGAQGMQLDAAASEYSPAAQAEHELALAAAQVPGGQLVQFVCPLRCCAVPAKQGRGAPEPSQ